MVGRNSIQTIIHSSLFHSLQAHSLLYAPLGDFNGIGSCRRSEGFRVCWAEPDVGPLEFIMAAPLVIFFDSHGYAWQACPVENLDAKAFGPTGSAHILTPEELEVMNLHSEDKTPWAMALDQGRLIPGDSELGEWDTLKE